MCEVCEVSKASPQWLLGNVEEFPLLCGFAFVYAEIFQMAMLFKFVRMYFLKWKAFKSSEICLLNVELI